MTRAARRLRPFVEHAVAALLSAVSVGLLLAIAGSLLSTVGVHIDGGTWWRFGIAASLVGGNLLALLLGRRAPNDDR